MPRQVERSLAASALRERREALGLTQEQLASRAGLALRTVQRAENGQVASFQATLFVLAHALGCDVADLSGNEREAA